MFSKPDIQALFQPYIFVALYTDIVPNEFYSPELRNSFGSSTSRQTADATEANFVFQETGLGDVRLPLYTVLEPTLDDRILVLGIYEEGLINNEAAFRDFLRDPK